ncbi:cryptochrome/photolyase family protein [Algihabitans albus]|uniref:cryptochrome/photolyase family protein n=1 Tax=Algihabitans albus TaxID=2164067 RepID=UPI000E5CF092|nr:cryptochrome/photolyase family protein [Algihabitans albus]
MQIAALRLVLGDQLSRGLSSLSDLDADRDRVLLVEVWEEATYVRHHKKKIAFLFSAMRHFAVALKQEGIAVDYVTLDDPENGGSFLGELRRAVARHAPERIVVTEPGEWRLSEAMGRWEAELDLPVEIRADDRFFCSHAAFADWAKERKSLRMEYFYREMRRRTGILMDSGGQPEGGRWNFDQENRKVLPEDLSAPEILQVPPDDITGDVLDLVAARFADHFGELYPFWFAVTAEQAETAFEVFVQERLPNFGDYQDAMAFGEATLFHSVISQYLNAGLLDPQAVCTRVERAWRDGTAPLNAVEGFIRQVLGWREFVRGIYWLKMPDYADENFLEARRDLPAFYWTGETEMVCLSEAISQTRQNAYAHHIQRLMVTGNFALLAGVHPAAVNEWYLVVYADAYQWVELPNVTGMALFADGGAFASKPYAASGKYIDRMSNYCRSCSYDVKRQTGDGVCPFNFLYWDFIARNGAKLEKNPRMALILKSFQRMKPEKVAAMRQQAEAFLAGLETVEEGEWRAL